jgi:hypothetical protein
MKVLAHQGRTNYELRVTCAKGNLTLMRETQNGWEFEKVQKKFEQQKLQELKNLARPDVPI